MSRQKLGAGPDWPTWQQLVFAVPAGVAAAVFLAIRWPWDLLVVAVLLGYVVMLGALLRWNRYPGQLGRALLQFGCIFLALLTAVGSYVSAIVPQRWLSVPGLLAMAVLAVVLGALAVAIPRWR